MSKISKASSLCSLLLVFVLLSSRPALSLRGPKLLSEPKSAQSLMDDSSSMNKIESGNAKSMIGGFFSHMFPLKGWPFPKYPPFTMVNPNIPTNPSGAQEETTKLPSSPSKGNKDGGNA
ncbi:PREDICTED: uncharacterized protein LOC104724990 [Camelina sativa]|uniref:Uncharacterized protein LOC104724990 n=1 Tax=Camelina sativa TaxID=90675 RepID=A0ABM0UJ23_CAMSA|nr:PREDICTED: uncharacterized protein LOC104724990 [Camelina sativa]